MPEMINLLEKPLVLEEIFDPVLVKQIYKEIMGTRELKGDDDFTYGVIEKIKEGKTYLITSRHVPISECMTFSKSSCNKCYGTGRKMMSVNKGNIPNVEDFVMLASVSLTGLSEEQKRIVLEKEKASNFWKILLPCPCTIKNMLKKGKHIVSNDLNNIVIEITCTEKTSE